MVFLKNKEIKSHPTYARSVALHVTNVTQPLCAISATLGETHCVQTAKIRLSLANKRKVFCCMIHFTQTIKTKL